MQTGKDAKLRLINLDNMSGAGAPAHVGGEIQLINVPQGGGGMREQPATWVDGGGTSWLFVANGSGISGLKLGLNGSNVPQLTSVWQNGAVQHDLADRRERRALQHQRLLAAAPASSRAIPRPATCSGPASTIGSPHWQSPIIVNGVIYVMDGAGKLWAFGLDQLPDEIFGNGFDG